MVKPGDRVKMTAGGRNGIPYSGRRKKYYIGAGIVSKILKLNINFVDRKSTNYLTVHFII